MEIKRKNKKALVLQKECVACGCCLKECPRKAITIIDGVFAKIDEDLCVGCGLCQKACPASVIKMEDL